MQPSTLARAFSAAAFFVFFAVSAADWFPRVWQVDDGLPDNSISGLCRTSDGFLWVATDGGLMRFDGVRFEEFSRPLEGVANRVIRTMLLDHRGRIWLAMDRGAVICADTTSARVFTARDGMPDLRAAVLAEDGDGAIWVGYAGGSACRIKDGKVTRLGSRDGLSGSGSVWLAGDALGKLWFAKGRSVGVFRDGHFQTLCTTESLVTRITPAQSGGIWILSGEHLSKFHEGKELKKTIKLPQSSVTPSVLLEDRERNVWIGTVAHGLFRYDGKSIESVGTSHPEITCLTQDPEGNIWVGTRGGGLNQIRARTLELINTGLGQPYESVRSLCEDSSGTLWLATQNGTVVHQAVNEEWLSLTAENGWPGGHAACVAAGPQGGVWIGTRDRGLFFFQTNHFKTWASVDGLASESVRSLLVCSNGDLWIGTDSPRRLQRYRAGDFLTLRLPGQARSIRAMTEDAGGNIWAATADGRLLEVSGERLIDQTTNLMQRPLSIRCLHATADGTLWIGYANWGLGRLKNGHFCRITSQQGLNDDYISQMVSDGRGWLWCAGNHGLFRANIEALVALAEGRAAHVRSLVYGRPEGLPSLQASYDNSPGALRGRDGQLRFPMRTGLLLVHPDAIRDNPDPPPVLLERVTVDGQLIALYDSRCPLREPRQAIDLRDNLRKIELPPNHRKVEFQFTALSMTAPENVHFRYRLEGVDDGWVEAGAARQTSYSRLPAGSYRFHVCACNNTGVWNETGVTLGFAVLPFFWQTWWFRALSTAAFATAIAGAALVVASRRYRVKLRKIQQQAALERERARIAKDLHDDLGGSLTQVSMLLELALRDRAAPDKLSSHVSEGLGAARQMIKSLDETVWAINPRNDSLPHLINYIGQFAQRFLATAELRCRLDLPENPPEIVMSADVRHNLFLVLKEALNNIVRHARASEVALNIAVSEACLELSIQDNGCGLHANGGPDEPGADGLRNMEQRMKEIGGSCQIKSSSEGTRITFLYPWPKQHAPSVNGTVKPN